MYTESVRGSDVQQTFYRDKDNNSCMQKCVICFGGNKNKKYCFKSFMRLYC